MSKRNGPFLEDIYVVTQILYLMRTVAPHAAALHRLLPHGPGAVHELFKLSSGALHPFSDEASPYSVVVAATINTKEGAHSGVHALKHLRGVGHAVIDKTRSLLFTLYIFLCITSSSCQ